MSTYPRPISLHTYPRPPSRAGYAPEAALRYKATNFFLHSRESPSWPRLLTKILLLPTLCFTKSLGRDSCVSLINPPSATQGAVRQGGLVRYFLPSAKFIYMGKQKNRLTHLPGLGHQVNSPTLKLPYSHPTYT